MNTSRYTLGCSSLIISILVITTLWAALLSVTNKLIAALPW